MIEVYTTQNCSACVALKSFLKSEQVPFIEKDATNEDIFQEMAVNSNSFSVPQIQYKGQWLVGFNKQVLKSFLGLEEDDFLLESKGFTGEMQVCESCQG